MSTDIYDENPNIFTPLPSSLIHSMMHMSKSLPLLYSRVRTLN